MATIVVQQRGPWDFDSIALVDLLLTGVPEPPDPLNQGFAILHDPSGHEVWIYGSGFSYDPDGRVVSGTITRVHVYVGDPLEAGALLLVVYDLSLDVALARLADPGTYPLDADPTYIYEAINAGQGAFGFRFSGAAGDDTMVASQGADTLFGLDGDDSITGYLGRDEIYGGLGNDTLVAGTEGGLFDGGDDNDLIQGGQGDDVMWGGAGNDTLLGTYSNEWPWGAGKGQDSIYGGDGDDSIAAGDDGGLYDGGDGNDLIRGAGGPDVIWGGSGNDRMLGGEDLYKNDYGIDEIHGGLGDDWITAGLIGGYYDGGDGDDLIEGGPGDEKMWGGSGKDTLTGGKGHDELEGGDGDDSLAGAGGNDWFAGGGGHDVLDGGSGRDAADYSDKDQVVEVRLNRDQFVTVKVGGVAQDTIRNIEAIFGGARADKLIGDDRANFFAGYGGKDLIDGGGGRDTAFYTERTERVEITLSGADRAVVKVGGVSEDKLRNVECVYGGSAGDRLTGDTRKNLLVGNAGADTLSGGGGNDSLFGGRGKDALAGGAGADFFYFDERPRSSSADQIRDFEAGHDGIVVSRSWMPDIVKEDGLYDYNICLGKAATDHNQYLIYDVSSGRVYYDPDGSGSKKQVLLATLLNRPDVEYDSFWLL
jgi:Ca2+-binding RTX toxin-like protein